MKIVLKNSSLVFQSKQQVDRFVEYIQGDGNSWLDLGITGYKDAPYGTPPSDVPALEVKVLYPDRGADFDTKMLGGTLSSSYLRFFVATADTTVALNSSSQGAKGDVTLNSSIKTTPVTIKYGGVESSVDGTVQITNSANQYRINNYESNILLFRGSYNNSDAGIINTRVRLYECKYYEGANLLHHWKPYVKRTGEVGMLDIVPSTPVFYANQGSGTFLFEELSE